MTEMPADDRERPLTEDERMTIACEWRDYRSAYAPASADLKAMHAGFVAGWTARHLFGYTPETKENGTA